MGFSLDRYLDRLGIGAPAPDADGLAALQRAHLHALPFANIDAFLGVAPSLDLDVIACKLVEENRGGWCFEHNLLFEAGLRAVGFEVSRVMARVRMGQPHGGARSHLALIVTTGDSEWLADAGFGGPAPDRPLPLAPGVEHDDTCGTYRLVEDPATGETVLERRKGDGGWFALYGFARERVQFEDIAGANVMCAAWRSQRIAASLMLSRRSPRGRIGVLDTDITVTTPQGDRWETLSTQAELAGLLRDRIGLEIADETIRQIARRLGLRDIRVA